MSTFHPKRLQFRSNPSLEVSSSAEQVFHTDSAVKEDKRVMGGMFPPFFSDILKRIGQERQGRMKKRIKINKIRPISFTELRNNFVSKISSIKALDSKKFLIKDGKLYKKYTITEDPATYTKSRNYDRLLKNIIRSRAKIEKEKKKTITRNGRYLVRRPTLRMSHVENKLVKVVRHKKILKQASLSPNSKMVTTTISVSKSYGTVLRQF